MESAYIALLHQWVDVDGYTAPYSMRKIVKSCAKDLREAFEREGVAYDYIENLVTGRRHFNFAKTDKPCANAEKAVRIARALAASNGKSTGDATNT